MKSVPLLKFRNDVAFLAPEGIAVIKALPGLICPVIFIGDGRSGKSFLASHLLGDPNAFVSDDTAEPVTEGIDIVVAPVSSLLGGDGTAQEGEHVLVLDCEGGNNAIGAIRTLVNVFGIILGTTVVFVVAGMASEQALQNLGASLAARTLIRFHGKSSLRDQQLFFIVNRNHLKYDDSTLETMLAPRKTKKKKQQTSDDAARNELRESIRDAFAQRYFIAVPVMGMPGSHEQIEAMQKQILSNRKALTISGTHVSGEQLCSILGLIVEDIKMTNEVSFGSINRLVVYDGFLEPVAIRLYQKVKEGLPRLHDYDPDLGKYDPRQDAMDKFEDEVSHIAFKGLVDEARTLLREHIDRCWTEVERANDALGDQVEGVSHEYRDVQVDRSQAAIGGRGLLKLVVVDKVQCRVETRAVVHRRRGGDPDCSPWSDTGTRKEFIEQSAFEALDDLPVITAKLKKQSPHVMRTMLKSFGMSSQPRLCMVKDGHFLWWDPDDKEASHAEAKGCINFLVHGAEVVADPSSETSFTIRPATSWASPHSFSGGQHRQFHFDAEECEVHRDRWVEAIARHIDFGKLASEQLGRKSVIHQVGVFRPSLSYVGLQDVSAAMYL
mmetsp:Transcript_66942/g.143130  ORF Transcript_66942/g.143130 Transcript_66942/m.143130 type:complete len:608 (+) Transcript_66942:76-1899(+)